MRTADYTHLWSRLPWYEMSDDAFCAAWHVENEMWLIECIAEDEGTDPHDNPVYRQGLAWLQELVDRL